MKPIPFFYLCVAVFVLNGCSATYRQQRDIKKLDALAVQQQPEFKRLANILDPCFSGKAKSDTVISTHTDTLVKDGITTIVKVKDTVYVTKTLPGRTIINTRTLSIHDTLRDQRSENVINNVLRLKADSLIIVKTQQASTKHTLNIWRLIAISLISLLAIYFIARIIIFFYGGGWTNTIKKVI